MYFIARWYRGPLLGKLIADLRRDTNQSLLATALTAASLRRLGVPVKIPRNIDPVAEPFCVEGKDKFGSSQELVAALILEAQSFPKPAKTKPVKLDRFNGIDVERIVGAKNLREIAGLPALAAKLANARITSTVLDDIYIYTTYGWIAYMIYDQFLDEGGDPTLLPVANRAQREMNRYFLSKLPGLADALLDRVDSANLWEANHCRCKPDALVGDIVLPDYGDLMPLADRSIGHALAVLAVLVEAGFAIDSPKVNQTITFFEHYLIARQLNDDAHDWQEDLDHGQINSVGTELLKGVDPNKRLDDPVLRKEMAERFWNQYILVVCQRILNELNLARDTHNGALEPLLAPVERAARKALDEHKKASNSWRHTAKQCNTLRHACRLRVPLMYYIVSHTQSDTPRPCCTYTLKYGMLRPQ